MNNEIQGLQEKIQRLKGKKRGNVSSGINGYGVTVVMLTDLMSCILVGLALGIFFQKFFYTSVLLTAGLTFLGGVAGLYRVIRFAIVEEKKSK